MFLHMHLYRCFASLFIIKISIISIIIVEHFQLDWYLVYHHNWLLSMLSFVLLFQCSIVNIVDITVIIVDVLLIVEV